MKYLAQFVLIKGAILSAIYPKKKKKPTNIYVFNVLPTKGLDVVKAPKQINLRR